MEHFGELLNRPAPQDPPDIPPANDDLPNRLWMWSTHQEGNIPGRQKVKNGKSAGPDSILAEALKTDIETSVELLYSLFKKIWEEEQVPSEWKEGYLIKPPKKGDLSSCSELQKKNTTVHPRQGVQSSATEQDERCSWPPA